MEIKSAHQLAAERAIRVLGGPAQAARVLNVKDHRHQTVQGWLKTRVPAEQCPGIERATLERGPDKVVRCEELRPDVPWGILREQAA